MRKTTYEIYRIPKVFPKWSEYTTKSWSSLSANELAFSRFHYRKVYIGEILDMCGLHHPMEDEARTLSISDVVVVTMESEATVYYVDESGYVDITDTWFSEWLTADDFTDIEYEGSEYSYFGHTASHQFSAMIHGLPETFIYELTRHDGEEESFRFHADGVDIWDTITIQDRRRLDEIFDKEMRIGRYEKKFQKCLTASELKEVEYEFMEDETFPKSMNLRFWNGYSKRLEALSQKTS